MEPGQQLPSIAKIKRGVRVFVVLSLAGLVFVMYRASLADSISHLRAFDWRFLLVGFALIVFDMAASGARIYIFASRVQPGLTYLGCIQASLANIFLGGVTPSQTGGGPGQIYVLYKEGMRIFDAVVVSFIGCFLLTAVFFPVCGLAVMIFAGPTAIDFRLQYVVKGSILAFSLVVLLVVIAMASPHRFQSAVRSILGRIPVLGRWLDKKGTLDAWLDLFQRYHDLWMFFLKKGKRFFLAGFVLTTLIYFNKFVIAYVVLKGLGITAPFWDVVYAQLVMMLIFYFSPSPGAAGIAEVSAAAVMGDIIPGGFEGAFVLLWRFFTLYASLVVGAIVLSRYIYKKRAPGE